ncbi:HSF-type DNA-binding [Thraustotheca clavata]|uniref:HSF-type DNA-binding n=1 Tax=Thraustotheca clavata TaxID=74557 RepID=A0A1V9ZQA0_9STRA|nr:HSF-type DNA-binding [Thraustotheca clavata]
MARNNMSAALFLQKTYDMIKVCPEQVAAWTNDGRSFVVNEIKALESTWLPRYFKHNNFTSFARQLKFYGFDKYKKHQQANDHENDSVWEFSHPQFLRDDPDKMVAIRRKTNTSLDAGDKVDKTEVAALKEKMNSLESQLSALTNQIEVLTSFVHSYCESTIGEEPLAKKPRLMSSSPRDVTIAPKDMSDIDDGILDTLLFGTSPQSLPFDTQMPLLL